jgi:hypothetical protein
MRIDAYTKVVLTVIAGCLLWLCVSGTLTAPVSAQAPAAPQEVILVGVRGAVPIFSPPRTAVTVVYGAETAVPVKPDIEWYARPLPSRVSNAEPLSVRLVGVERPPMGRWDAVDVNVKPSPKSPTPGRPVPGTR